MLSFLLPGIRHVRTPIIVGYLLLYCVYLIFGKNLFPPFVTNLFTERTAELLEYFGTTAAIVALSLLSYLIGSVLTIRALRSVEQGIAPDEPWTPYGLSELSWMSRRHHRTRAITRAVRRWVESPRHDKIGKIRRTMVRAIRNLPGALRYAVPRLPANLVGFIYKNRRIDFERSLDTWVARELSGPFNRGLTVDEIASASEVREDFKFTVADGMGHRHLYPKHRREYEDMPEGEKQIADLQDGWEIVRRNAATAVRSEFEIIALRLQIQRQELYNEYDRIRSEAELRYSISLPLLALLFTISIETSWLAFAGLLFVAILFVGGVGRQLSAQELIVQALTAGVVTAPTVEDLLAIDTTGLEKPPTMYIPI